MRLIIAILSLTIGSLAASPASAGRLDDIEDAAEDYRKAVKSVRKDLDKDRSTPPYLVQLAHRLEHAADLLEELADDDHPLGEIRGAYEEVAALHYRLAELTYDGCPHGGRHIARRLEKVHRYFNELDAEVRCVCDAPALPYRSRSPWTAPHRDPHNHWHPQDHHRRVAPRHPGHSMKRSVRSHLLGAALSHLFH